MTPPARRRKSPLLVRHEIKPKRSTNNDVPAAQRSVATIRVPPTSNAAKTAKFCHTACSARLGPLLARAGRGHAHGHWISASRRAACRRSAAARFTQATGCEAKRSLPAGNRQIVRGSSNPWRALDRLRERGDASFCAPLILPSPPHIEPWAQSASLFAGRRLGLRALRSGESRCHDPLDGIKAAALSSSRRPRAAAAQKQLQPRL